MRRRHGGASNTAGAPSGPAPAVECTEAYWDQVMVVNLKGVWLCLRYAIPLLLLEGGGAIVDTASVFGQVGLAHQPGHPPAPVPPALFPLVR